MQCEFKMMYLFENWILKNLERNNVTNWIKQDITWLVDTQ
jgi:hypothetical protein